METCSLPGVEQQPTGMQCAVLGFVKENSENNDIFQKDIETHFNIRRSTATGILQLMEQSNLITRESVDSDARLKRIVLTEYGIQMNKKATDRIFKVEHQLKKNLTQEEVETLFELLDKILENTR